jgi:hypothetical protein
MGGRALKNTITFVLLLIKTKKYEKNILHSKYIEQLFKVKFLT